jgi:hypothetical protein
MPNLRTRPLTLNAVVLLALTLLLVPASAAAAEPSVVVDYQSDGWKFLQVPHGQHAGFESTSFDDTGWATGQAGFGSLDPASCAWNDPAKVHTEWAVNTDMLLRRRFALPAGVTTMHLSGTIDDSADIYLNGSMLARVDSGYCGRDAINIDIPSTLLRSDNVLAIRGIDTGVANFLDVQLTATGQFNNPPVFTAHPSDVVYAPHAVGAATVFTVAARDPEGGPVTLSHTTLPSRPETACVDARPATGAAMTCTVRTTRQMPDGSQQVLFMASDAQGQTVSVPVTIGGTTNAGARTARPGAVIPAIESVGTTDRLQLDLTADGKDPFCGSNATPCTARFYPWAGKYFKKPATVHVIMKNKTTGRTCDSSETRAARVTPIKPAGSETLGYRIAFDANCGKGTVLRYDGVVVNLFTTDAAGAYTYQADRYTSTLGAGPAIANIADRGHHNGRTCWAAGQLEFLQSVLGVKDRVELLAAMKSPQFRKKLTEFVFGELLEGSYPAPPATSSCDVAKMYRAAAALVHAEALFALGAGTPLRLRDRIKLNGNRSEWQLFVADNAALSPTSTAWVQVISISTSEENAVLARNMIAGLARTPAS